MRPREARLLDSFCGGGGAAVGYARAGYSVTGVDHLPMPSYPFFDIIQSDVFEVLADDDYVRQFAVVHASPICKGYTPLRHLSTFQHPRQIPAVRARLRELGVPYVIENVEGARDEMVDPITLCGSMFGLGLGDAVLRRHRLFESNLPLSPPGPCRCKGRPIVGVYGTGGGWTRTAPGGGGTKVSGKDAAQAMGVDWTNNQPALAQMVPPAYTEHVGRQVRAALGEGGA